MASRQSDYLLRMIEELRLFISQIVHLRTEGCHDQALAAIVQAQERLFGLSADKIFTLGPADQFALLLKQETPEIAREKSLVLADLLSETARVYTAKGQPALALGAWRFALEIMELAVAQFPDTPERELAKGLEKIRAEADEAE